MKYIREDFKIIRVSDTQFRVSRREYVRKYVWFGKLEPTTVFVVVGADLEPFGEFDPFEFTSELAAENYINSIVN